MELELEGGNAIAFIVIITLIILLFFGMVGKFVTPIDATGEPTWLSPSRWTAYKLQKEASKEAKRLVKDAQRIQRILESSAPDPVEAMLTAQDIYANYQKGSSATAAARNALIAAAQATVRTTIGEIPRDQAIAAYQAALERIDALSVVSRPKNDSIVPFPSYLIYIPLVSS